jgi:hypothetical protein
MPSALEKDRSVPLRLERRRLTPAGAFAFDESEAKANGITAAIRNDGFRPMARNAGAAPSRQGGGSFGSLWQTESGCAAANRMLVTFAAASNSPSMQAQKWP